MVFDTGKIILAYLKSLEANQARVEGVIITVKPKRDGYEKKTSSDFTYELDRLLEFNK